MSLQQRLTLYFVVIVILPLAAAGFVVQRVIGEEIAERAVVSLRPALDATVALYNNRTQVMERRVRLAVEGERFVSALRAGNARDMNAYLSRQLQETADLDLLIVLDRRGDPLGQAFRDAEFVPGFAQPSREAILSAGPGVGPTFNRTVAMPVKLEGSGVIGKLIGGFWLDKNLLVASAGSGPRLSVVSGGRIIASTAAVGGPLPVQAEFFDSFEADIGEPSKAAAVELEDGVGIVASTASAPIEGSLRRVVISLLILLGLALLGTTALAYLLARWISQPLEEVAEGAEAIAHGRFDHHIPVRSRDEVGQLAAAFNDMTGRLEDTVRQLSYSRDQLRRTIRRVGDTLRSTHDMKQMLESVMNTAADALDADAAVLWSFTPTRDEIYPSIGREVDVDTLSRLKIGEGMAGLVAERASSVIIPPPGDVGSGPRFSRNEPSFPVALATPLYSQDRMVGVLTVYRSDPRRHFGGEDLEMLNFLAEQGGVAIENVLLHEEAQRLSLTDGLTGTHNRRFFQMQFRQALATATRFKRPFSVLMMDLDKFKVVNDTYGHQRGDAILIEFSQRVTRTLREIDTFARYGGEEFIALLPETDLEGARTTSQKILDAIRSEPFGELDEAPVRLTVSIGVASYPDNGDTFNALIDAADRALYRAKQLGRDKVTVAEKLKLVR